MPRPSHLTLVPPAPISDRPLPRSVSSEARAEAENIRARLAMALRSLSTHDSTDVALSRSKAELYALATAMQKLARRLPS